MLLTYSGQERLGESLNSDCFSWTGKNREIIEQREEKRELSDFNLLMSWASRSR
jgi:hypothetical protein